MRERQKEYAANVPKPKKPEPVKHDISHIAVLPGTMVSKDSPKKEEKKSMSPEKIRKNEYDMLEQKRDLYVDQVGRIKRELGI